MKTCKACYTEIHEKATKCPHCQSHQNSWNLRLMLLLIPLPFLIFFLINMITQFDRADFEEYKEQVTFTQSSSELYKTRGGHDRIKIIGEIDNQTDKDWRMPEYKITFKNEKDEFVHAAFESGIQTRVRAHTKTTTAVNVFVGTMKEGLTYDIELYDMKEEWQ